jgi:TonB family protein
VLLKAPVGLNGQFEFPRVLNGTYTLTFVSNGGIPVSQSVVVMGANVVANLTAPPHKEVAGRAMVEGFAGEFVFGIALRRQGEPEATIIVFPQANGKFRVALPLGESELSVVSGQADSFTYGATDLQRESLTIRAQDNAGELTIRLKRQQPQVSGNDVDDRLGLASLLGLPQTPTVSRETVFLPAEGITPPQPIKTPNPGYSEWARKARFSGVLTMELIVDVDGNARVVRVIQSIGYGLDESAIATVEAWKFRPATRNGQPVAVRMKMAVTFRLL